MKGKPSPLKGTIRPNLWRARVGNCEECGKEYRAVGDHKGRTPQKYCSMKCAQIAWKRDKRPNIVPSNFAVKERNAAWKGDGVGYAGVHKWIQKIKGRPRKCEHCGTTRARKYEWANKDHEYRRNPDDYMRLCTRCHRRYDYAVM